MKISDAFAEYRRIEIQGRGCSLKTDEGVKYAGVVAERFFGDVNIKKLGIKQINDFYMNLRSTVSQNTARDYLIKLRSVVRFCHNRGIHTIDPATIVVPKREKKQANFIDLQQYDQFYEEINRPRRGYAKINRIRNALIVKMLFNTGLRISELCALNRDTIRNRQFTVVGKSKHPRPCFITKEIEEDIQAYLEMRTDDNPALFIANETGKRVTPGNIQRVFRNAAKQMGIRITPHTMRHSFATRMLSDRVDIRYIAELLGHQDLSTTHQYTHIRDYRLKEIYLSVVENSA